MGHVVMQQLLCQVQNMIHSLLTMDHFHIILIFSQVLRFVHISFLGQVNNVGFSILFFPVDAIETSKLYLRFP